jgi:hypothetical protein
MSTVKISQLPIISAINANTSNTLFAGVDIPSGITGKMTAHVLAQGLYSNEVLNVGINQQNLPNTIAQFSLSGQSYIQTNLVNINDNGTADIVATANTGSGGTDSTNFIDMGYANKNYQPGVAYNDIGNAVNPLDGYLYVQGGAYANGGNLIVGTTTTNTSLKFIVGGGSLANVVASSNASNFTINNILDLNNYIIFGDGTSQNTAAASLAYTQAAFALANSVNAAITYQSGVDVTQNTNTQFAWNKANTAVQNTAIVQLNTVQLTGNLIANSTGQGIFVDKFTSNTATFSQNMVVLGNLTANTLMGNIFFSNIVTTTSQSNSILWLPQASIPTQQVAQLWYYSNTQSLILDTDISGDRLSISKVLFFRGFNSTGATIPANSFVRLVSGVTSNQIPYIALADATSSANATVAGFVKNAIANGAYGFTYSQGIVEDLNSTGLGQNGDILFLSTTPGLSSNTAPTGAANTVVQLGRIILNDATQGKVFVQNQLRQAYGRPNGQLLYAYANNIVGSNTVSVNDATGTLNVNTIIANTVISITDFVSGNVTANAVIANNIIQYNAAVNNNTVTQITSKSTAVTSNGRTGQITTSNAALNKGVAVQFTVNNSYIVSAKDIVILNIASGASVGYAISVNNITPGSFQVNLHNADSTPSGSNASDTLVINYAIIRVN